MFGRRSGEALMDLKRDGFADARIRLERALDMRYAGQGYEITLPCDDDALHRHGIAGLRRRFDDMHQQMFGHMAPDQPVEVISYRLCGIGMVSAPPIRKYNPTGARLSDALREHRRVRFCGENPAFPAYQPDRPAARLARLDPPPLDRFPSTPPSSPHPPHPQHTR